MPDRWEDGDLWVLGLVVCVASALLVIGLIVSAVTG